MKKRIKVGYLSRVEGEGGIRIEIKDNVIQSMNLKVFEAPRFFEPTLRGRSFQDVIDFTARICGICPAAYQMSAVHAIEAAMGLDVEKPIKQLRRLLYAGEWIESHALHVYFLHGPDFYGLESAWSGKDYARILQRGLMLKKFGNRILAVLGGRPIHPVSVRAGGFFSVPGRKELHDMLPFLEQGYEEAIKGIQWSASLFHEIQPETNQEYEFVALNDPEGYPMNRGRVVTSSGGEFSMEEFLASIEEYQVEYSNALHSGIKMNSSRQPYIVGPISRLNLNYACLPEEIKTVLKDSGVTLPLTDIRMSIIARSVEVVYAFFEAMRIIKDYDEPGRPYIDMESRKGKAAWITEAPRGILIHNYEFDRYGKVLNARIIPPTSQNLAHMEKTLYKFVANNIDKPVAYITRGCEYIVRSYDPCISCSVHLVVL